MMENVDPPQPEEVGNDEGINPPTIDHDTNPTSRRNSCNKSGISRGKRGEKSKRHWETAIVANFSAEASAPPAVDMAHDDFHDMPEDDTKSQIGLELAAEKVKSVQKKGYQKRRIKEEKANHTE